MNESTQTYKFSFKGEVGEFFGIWFVNAILAMMTLGFYSPWAKVRTMQYFYGNTELAGGHFQFLANPWHLLKGRIIAVALLIPFVIVQIMAELSTIAVVVYVGIIVVYLLIVPLILVQFLSFRLRYSAWRGLSFRFHKDYAGAYRVYLAPVLILGLALISFMLPIVYAGMDDGMPISGESVTEDSTGHVAPAAIVHNDVPLENSEAEDVADPMVDDRNRSNSTDDNDANDEDSHDIFGKIDWPYFLPAALLVVLFFMLLPYFDFINARFLARNTRFGVARLSFAALPTHYYSVYGVWLTASLAVSGGWLLLYNLASTTTDAFILSGIAVIYIFLSRAYLKVKRYQLLIDNIEIEGGHCLEARPSFWKFSWLMLTNSLGMIFSLGLLKAWVMVRTARFFLNCTSLSGHASLDNFVAGQSEKVSALMEEGVDVFDLELV